MRISGLGMLSLLAAALTFVPVSAAPPLPSPLPGPELFAAHRQRFLEKLPPGSVAVIHAAPESEGVSGDPYRQDSDFWYLTGLSEPEAVAVFLRDAERGKQYLLFVRPRNPVEEQWTGARTGPEGAGAVHHADRGFSLSELDQKIPEILKAARSLFYRDGGEEKFGRKLTTDWQAATADAAEPRPIADAGPLVHQLRLVKDDTEIALMRRAATLSVEAHRAAMERVKPGAHEFELKARMVERCLAGGAARMAYPPIVGSGPNSVVLHYDRADRRMNAGEMIVNDTACEYSMYSADVTRSYPVSGRFSVEQRAIYQIVLDAQKAGIAKVAPGVLYHEVYDATVGVVVDGLLKLGLMKGDRVEIIKSRAYKAFYPHGSSHWLGLNVHDSGSYRYIRTEERYDKYTTAQTKLEPGMVLTVEPGIYIGEAAAGVDARWANIGVRIEDDILVTPGGNECLSCASPREIGDVEKALTR
ncbi:MAG: aminopeptidase P N-terminal domain-containing protein [Thermoanaerobaculia bacterium]